MAARVVLVTGCSSGIGAAAARAFARQGDHVFASMRRREDAEELTALAAVENLDISPLLLDVTSAQDIKSAVAVILQKHGRLDVLVNNAGMLPLGAFESISEPDLRQAMEVNFFAATALTRAVLPSMRARRAGCIVMVSSLSGVAGLAGDSAYAASKFALEGFSEALRAEIARFNIRLALIEPGQVATRLFRPKPAYHGPEDYEAFNDWIGEKAATPAPHAMKPESVADIIVEAAGSDGKRFRWPVGDVAHRVMQDLFAQDDDARNRYLAEVSGAGWWVRGAPHP